MSSSIYAGGTGSPSSGLEELVLAARRSIAAYRLAERAVQDHRVQAALVRLRLDHERHVEELLELHRETLGADGGAAGVSDPSTDPAVLGPVADAVIRGDVSGASVLEAVRAAESEMHRLYESHVSRNYMEPLRAALARHCREEEAHVAFLNESGHLARLGPLVSDDAATGQDVAQSPPVPADGLPAA